MRSDEICDEEKDVLVKNDPEFPSVLITYQHYHQSYKLMWYRISKRCLFRFPMVYRSTRGYTFWSSFDCEGGSHVKHMHAVSLLIHPDFFSELMITWPNLFEISTFISSNWIKSGNSNHVITNCSKFPFWSPFIVSSWIKNEISKK